MPIEKEIFNEVQNADTTAADNMWAWSREAPEYHAKHGDLASRIYGDVTSQVHLPETMQDDDFDYDQSAEYGEGIISDPKYGADPSRKLFYGVGSDFAGLVGGAQGGMIGDHSTEDLIHQYSNPKSELWSEGGFGSQSRLINPHVPYTGDHDLAGDNFWIYGDQAGKYVDDVKGLY